ncbi:MAG: phosphoglyceromutase [Cyanobacteria bacterium P01_A01_bin.123]
MLPSPKFLFVFLDGVGLGTAGCHNPLSDPCTMPTLTELVGTTWIVGTDVQLPKQLFKAIDAQLGVSGLPQSATGQTALFTGRNAPQFLGRHQTGFANGSLRRLIEESGLFKQVLAQDGTVAHANLYSPAYFEAIAQRRLRYSVGTLLCLTAGVTFAMQTEYEVGKAIFWDITGELAHNRGIVAPPISPGVAGKRLAQIAQSHSVTLFECYLPDFAGHAQDWSQSCRILQRIDRFLSTVVENLPAHVTLIVSSDHGNIEDLTTKRHTENLVPLWVVGEQATAFAPIEAITEITPKILQLLSVSC